MMKIDSHQHFWLYNEAEYDWIDGQMTVLQRNFLPSDLSVELDKTGFDGSIAVQARQCLEETEWLLALASSNPLIKGVVGWVDLCSPEVDRQLEKYGDSGKLVGVRHVLQGEPDDQFMLREDFLRGISLLEKYGLAYDILVFPKHLPYACQLVSRFPRIRFVLDHIAKPLIKDHIIGQWEKDIRLLASYPNVYCKVSGMVTEADWTDWKYADFQPYLDVVADAFGSDRLMVGSDWPVCTVSADYEKVMSIPFQYFKNYTEAEKEKIYSGNVIKAYGLKEDGL